MEPDQSVMERRKHTRYPCEVPFPASFLGHEGRVAATVEDISIEGAKLRIVNARDDAPFMVLGEREYVFKTDLGISACKGRTAWVQRVGRDFLWGIEFYDRVRTADDPLNQIIEHLELLERGTIVPTLLQNNP